MYGYEKSEIEIHDGKLIRCISWEEEVEIPDGITEIGDLAFLCCPNVRFLRIPDSVTKLGEAPFQGCNKLTGVHIPDHLLEGMAMISLVKLFAENPMNYPSQEYRLMEMFLSETGNFTNAFNQLLVDRLMHPFHVRRWLHTGIEKDQAKWVEKILSYHESLPRAVVDECIDQATELQRTQILAVLMNYTQTHTITDEELTLDE